MRGYGDKKLEELSLPLLFFWNTFGWMKQLLPIWFVVWVGKTYVIESWNDSFMDIQFLGWVGICIFASIAEIIEKEWNSTE